MTPACDRSSSTWVMAHRLWNSGLSSLSYTRKHALHSGDAPAVLARLDSVQAAYDEGQFTKGAVTALMCRAKADLLPLPVVGVRRRRLRCPGQQEAAEPCSISEDPPLSGLCTGAEIESTDVGPGDLDA